jgi:hypothetical protein
MDIENKGKVKINANPKGISSKIFTIKIHAIKTIYDIFK